MESVYCCFILVRDHTQCVSVVIVLKVKPRMNDSEPNALAIAQAERIPGGLSNINNK